MCRQFVCAFSLTQAVVIISCRRNTCEVCAYHHHDTVDKPTKSYEFLTENGRIKADKEIDMYIRELQEVGQFAVLKDSPSVFSVGKFCVEFGYGF